MAAFIRYSYHLLDREIAHGDRPTVITRVHGGDVLGIEEAEASADEEASRTRGSNCCLLIGTIVQLYINDCVFYFTNRWIKNHV